MSNLKVDPKIVALQEDIETLTATINDPDTPEDLRAELQASVTEIKTEIQTLQKPKVEKPKKEKPVKAEVKLGNKSFKDASSQELEQAFSHRLEQVNKLGGKSKTKSIFSRNGSAANGELSTPATA